jgi:hypothetical protein
MNHLSPSELVDLVEGTPELPAERARHVETCEACRAAADSLCSVLHLATADGVPPPSPLYWDHLSSRVADAVRNEPAASTATARWWRWPITPWGAATAMAAVVVVAAVWRTTVYAPVPIPVPAIAISAPAAPGPSATAPEQPLDADDDAAWAVVRAAADDLRWEEAHAAGLSARPGSAERLALELTAEERIELARLLGIELKRNGA